jgi:3-dehydrosphinganine reductase
LANSPHALISGGSSGIGLALAQRLAARGHALTLLARDAARLADAQAMLAGTGATVRVASVDVRDEAAVNAAVSDAVAELGPPDLLVASAGIVIPGIFKDLPAAAFRETMAVNYDGTVHLVRAALPAMLARRAGRIVLVSSGAGLIGLYGYTPYAPTKFAVRGLAEALRAELRPEGIGVSIVYPPDTDTPQLREEVKVRPAITSKIAGGARVHSAEEVADAILKGVAAGRFTIAPGWEMGLLNRLHSLIGPVLHRFSFDPVIARMHGNDGGGAASG